MEIVASDFFYKAFGFSVRSKIHFPELLEVVNDKDSTDIEINFKDLSSLWLEWSDSGSRFVMNERLVMFKVPDIAIFLIEEGCRITVWPLNKYKEDVIRLYLLGSCMGAILMQRGILPLHGSAIDINGKAYAIVGNSGAGKSTLATAFLRKGYKLLTDDVIGVYFTKGNVPMVIPAYPQQKLWQESLDEFGIDSREYKSVYQRETKFAIPIKDQFSSVPLQLAGVFELTFSENEEIELNQLKGLSRLQTLLIHTYRNILIPNLGLTNWHFTNSTKIISQINMFQLRRPENRFTVNELVSQIFDCINKENEKNENLKCK
ncbi:energy-coupling factor transporter ATP-binding protein EcfA2 [Neobacillus niacini]|uniref:aldolase n=1 Tax=Neobacillus niacini TaxID=86668 RepID=UPI002863225F|nr:energy-coupling factor transporter ATP-binding protein EcfA2 [Neobacillus niacini]